MAPKMSRGMKRATIALAAVLTIAGAGTAYAYWTSTGTGDGTATTGTSVPFLITMDDAVGVIAPGSPGQTIDFTVTNPGPGVQYLGTVEAYLADSAGVDWVPADGCIRDAYEVLMTTTPQSGPLAVDGTATGQVTVRLSNLGDTNQDNCQGQTVPVHILAYNQIP